MKNLLKWGDSLFSIKHLESYSGMESRNINNLNDIYWYGSSTSTSLKLQINNKKGSWFLLLSFSMLLRLPRWIYEVWSMHLIFLQQQAWCKNEGLKGQDDGFIIRSATGYSLWREEWRKCLLRRCSLLKINYEYI